MYGIQRKQKSVYVQDVKVLILIEKEKAKTQIGKIFNTCQTNISRIVRNKTCRFETGEELLNQMMSDQKFNSLIEQWKESVK